MQSKHLAGLHMEPIDGCTSSLPQNRDCLLWSLIPATLISKLVGGRDFHSFRMLFFSSGKHLNKLFTRQWEKTNKTNYTRVSPSEVESRDFFNGCRLQHLRSFIIHDGSFFNSLILSAVLSYAGVEKAQLDIRKYCRRFHILFV